MTSPAPPEPTAAETAAAQLASARTVGAKKNRRLIGQLCLLTLGAFAFGFALVPLYSVMCQITGYGDEDTYYYDPSGGHGLQEDPNVLPKDQAWQNIVSFVLANSNNVTLQPQFSINTSSDLQTLQEAAAIAEEAHVAGGSTPAPEHAT